MTVSSDKLSRLVGMHRSPVRAIRSARSWLARPTVPLYQPGGHFIAPNVMFIDGWAERDGPLFIDRRSSNTRIHVATFSSVEQLVDDCKSTRSDGRCSATRAAQRADLARKNRELVQHSHGQASWWSESSSPWA